MPRPESRGFTLNADEPADGEGTETGLRLEGQLEVHTQVSPYRGGRNAQRRTHPEAAGQGAVGRPSLNLPGYSQFCRPGLRPGWCIHLPL